MNEIDSDIINKFFKQSPDISEYDYVEKWDIVYDLVDSIKAFKPTNYSKGYNKIDLREEGLAMVFTQSWSDDKGNTLLYIQGTGYIYNEEILVLLDSCHPCIISSNYEFYNSDGSTVWQTDMIKDNSYNSKCTVSQSPTYKEVLKYHLGVMKWLILSWTINPIH